MMRVRRVVSVVACAILAFPATHPATASSQDPQAPPADPAGIQINHDAVKCMVANEYPRLDATLIPADKVAKAYIYFKSNRSPFYYVIMEGTSARLPKPQLDAGPITYYLEVFTTGGGSVQTEENNSLVVRAARECKTRVAAIAPGDPVTVLGAVGDVLPGFSGVAGVAAPAAVVAGATTASMVGAGAAVVGLTSVVLLNTGNSSPSQ